VILSIETMIRRSKLLPHAQQVHCSFSRLSTYHSTRLINTSFAQNSDVRKASSSWYQTAKSSTVAARTSTAYENTTNQIYADYLEKTKRLDFSSVNMRVLTYPGSRIMQLGLHYTPEECHIISRSERKDILDYEIAAERKREQARHVGSNVISEAVIEKIRERMDNYTTNSTVSFLFFASKSLDLFSGGLFTGSSLFYFF
jgi:hypothetical protein